jgi:molybdopterin converting factor small subunit
MRILLFASLREMAGASRLDLELVPEHVAALLRHLENAFGDEFGRIAAAGSVVVDGRTVGPDHPLRAEDEVAILPPVSGG